ncbi:MAG TPA: TonB-dependent receptor [Terracidiphilus sp.]|nr:TonB-dependent receptor [Terracidiphilus sp.]
MASLPLRAQMRVTLTVEDRAGAPIRDARVENASGRRLSATGADGRATFECGTPCNVTVKAEGFGDVSTVVAGDPPASGGEQMKTVQLSPAAVVEQVTVTAYRSPLGDLESPAITRELPQAELQSTASVSMDDKLRQLPGAELFRRSSSLVANPSSQGISLRGLGSTSASRTLVKEDEVPLNDPVGGWIHWLEQPELAVRSVELVRGGASDLYGSGAIGGVVNMRVAQPEATSAEIRSSYGGRGTYAQSLLGQGKWGAWGLLGAGTVLGSDGYIQEAPWQRGPVDIASNAHAQNGMVLGDHERGAWREFVRASGFHEHRSNGTPYQENGTRLARYVGGADWRRAQGATLTLRLFGSDQTYQQTFSSITNAPKPGEPACTYRCGETPTRAARIPDNELGASAVWSQPVTAGLVMLAGADVRDVRVWDDEQTFGATGAMTKLHVHQRDSAPWGEALWTRGGWTVAASARVDFFENFDGKQLVSTASGFKPSPTQPVELDEQMFDPRVGISRKIGEHWAVSASGFRAFRAPTPSELYRSTQVGNQLTKPNGSLKSERATGWETGVASQRKWGVVRASWFDTEINRPIAAVTINPNSSPILLMRENLGQIESRGVSIDAELAPARGITVDGGYQYAHATVTKGATDVGNWIPEVARNMATLNVRAARARWGELSLLGRMSGRMYDDDANTNLLDGYFRMDAYGSHEFGRWIEVFAAGENLFDRTIEVAKTPTTTLGMPRTARAGVMIRIGPGGR